MNIISRDGDQIVTVAEAKSNSRDTSVAEDLLWSTWLDIAHSVAENETNLVFQLSTCEQVFDDSVINIHAPVRGIISVKTYDAEGVESISTDYKVKRTSAFGLKVTLTTKPCNYAVIRYIAGFGDYVATVNEKPITAGTISAYPEAISIIMFLTNHYYENRGVITDFKKFELPVGFDRVLDLIRKYL